MRNPNTNVLWRQALRHGLSSENRALEAGKHGLIDQATALVVMLLVSKHVQFASPRLSCYLGLIFEQEGQKQTKPQHTTAIHTHKKIQNGKKYTWRFRKPSDNYHLAPNSAWKHQNNVTAFGKPLKLTKSPFSLNFILYFHPEKVTLHEEVNWAYR